MANSKLKVSVLMSVFNGEKYLQESIESILSQTFRDFEFIIVDDGSTDETKNILSYWCQKDSRIKIIINPENIGLTKSLNKAISSARGEYIARQDADDISLRERLEKQVVFLDSNPEIKIVGTFGYIIDKRGRILKKNIVPISCDAIRKNLIRKNPFIHSSIMIRKDILDEAKGYNERFEFIQDYELWFRILKSGKGENLPLFLVKKRQQPEMISFKKGKEQLSAVIFLKKRVIKNENYRKFYYIYLVRPYIALWYFSLFKIFFK